MRANGQTHAHSPVLLALPRSFSRVSTGRGSLDFAYRRVTNGIKPQKPLSACHSAAPREIHAILFREFMEIPALGSDSLVFADDKTTGCAAPFRIKLPFVDGIIVPNVPLP